MVVLEGDLEAVTLDSRLGKRLAQRLLCRG